MATATSLSKLGYLAIREETVAGTPLTPNVFVELLSETLETNYAVVPSMTIAGNREGRLRAIQNKIEPVAGEIEFLVEPNTIGYFLNGFFGSPTTTTLQAATVFQHVFTPLNTLQTYTMDIRVAGTDYVKRLVGVRIAGLSFSQNDNKLTCRISIIGQYSFETSRITVAVAAGTTLTVDQTTGLTTADTILVKDRTAEGTTLATFTISAIPNETTITTNEAVAVQLDVNDYIVIQRNTAPSYTLSNELTWVGGSTFAIGDDINNTATDNCEDLTIDLSNEIEARWTASGVNYRNRYPSSILLKSFNAEGTFKRFIQNSGLLDDLRQNRNRAIRFRHYGATLSSAAAVAAAVTFGDAPNGTVTVTADTAGEAGNDFNLIRFAANTVDAISATISGNTITLLLATTAATNTATAIAAAIAALAGVGATAGGTGAGLITTAHNTVTLNLTGGRDANERAQLRFDFFRAQFQPFSQNLSSENIIDEEVAFHAYREPTTTYDLSTRIVLRNGISGY